MLRGRNSAASADEQPHIGNYRLLKTIGKGNFAKVKLARHILTGKEVSSGDGPWGVAAPPNCWHPGGSGGTAATATSYLSAGNEIWTDRCVDGDGVRGGGRVESCPAFYNI